MPDNYLPLILASASPRRRELLARFPLPFTVVPSQVEESFYSHLPPREMVMQLSEAKAREVAARHQGLILAADTTVVLGNEVMDKPQNASEATVMLQRLSGKRHHVYTGITLLASNSGTLVQEVEVTAVEFRTLSPAELQRYIATGEYLDKAGGYAAQGQAAAFIVGVNGCYHNVIGLPLQRLGVMLQSFGLSLF